MIMFHVNLPGCTQNTFLFGYLELPERPAPGGSFEVLLRTHYWLRLWKEALLPTAFLSIFVVEPRSLMVERLGCPGDGSGWVNG